MSDLKKRAALEWGGGSESWLYVEEHVRAARHLAAAGLRRACLGMLARAAELPEAAELLVHRHGVFAWIESLCNGPQPAEALSDQLGLLQRLLGSSGAGGWTAEANCANAPEA